MNTIWKFPLMVTSIQHVAMPTGAYPFTVQMQGNDLMMWAFCQTDRPTKLYKVAIYGTGHELSGYEQHIGTVQQGEFVWHVFIVGEVE